VTAKKLEILFPSLERDAVPVSFVQLPGIRTRSVDAFVEFAAPWLRDRLQEAPRVPPARSA